MKKSIFLFFLTLCLLFSVCALGESSSFALDSFYAGIIDYKGSDSEVIVPGEIDGHPIYTIHMHGFFHDDSITELTFEEPIHTFDIGAVAYLDHLVQIHLPESLRIIGRNNLTNFPLLESITVPAGVRYIGMSSFSYCDALQSVTFLGDAPYIETSCFNGLSNSFTCYVPDDQFDAYRAIIPEKITVQPSGKASIKIDLHVPESDFDFDPSSGTLLRYKATDPAIIIPESIGGTEVKVIGEKCFAENAMLCYVVIPEGVETISDNAFYRASSLLYVDCPDSLTFIGNRAFYCSYSGSHFRWSANLKTIGDEAFFRCLFGDEIIFPEGLESIGREAFLGTGYSSVYFPSTIKQIGEQAFAESFISYVSLPVYEVVEIPDDVFAQTGSLSSFVLPWDCPLHVYEYYKDKLSGHEKCKVWIANPKDVEYISGAYRYLRAPGEEDAYFLYTYAGTQENIMLHYTVRENRDGTTVNLPVIGIGKGVFKGNQSIKKFRVTRSFTVKTIDDEAFADSSLELIDLFYSIETIGAGAFRNCKNLTEITLPASVLSIGEGAFDGCDQLKSVTVLCDVSLIDENTFRNCTALQENPYGVVLSADASPEDIDYLSRVMGLPSGHSLRRQGDPEPEPEPAEEPEPMPVGKDGIPFLGTWQVSTITMSDTTYSAADLGLVLTMTLQENGIAISRNAQDGSETTGIWSPADGGAMIDGQFAVLQQDGTLLAETDGMSMTFLHLEEDVPDVPDVSTTEESSYAGIWHVSSVQIDGSLYPPEDFAAVFSIELREDGSYTLFNRQSPLLEGYWTASDTGVSLGILQLIPMENGALSAKAPGMLLIFTRTEDTVSKPQPEPVPEPQPEPEPAPMKPFNGEENAPYLGTWHVSNVQIDGTLYPPEDFAAVFSIEFMEDGSYTLFNREGPLFKGYWSASDSGLSLGVLQLVPMENDALSAETLGMVLIFTKTDNPVSDPQHEPLPEPQPKPVKSSIGEESIPYLGTWYVSNVQIDGGLYPPEDFAAVFSIELREDGSYTLFNREGPLFKGYWSASDSGLSIGFLQLAPMENDALSAEMLGMVLILNRADEAVSDPQPEPEPEPVKPSITEKGAPYLGTWQVTTMTMGETTYSAADLGLALTMTLHEDGSAISVNAQDGTETTGVWSLTDEGIIIDGQFAILQEDGTLFAEMDGMNMTLARPESIGAETPVGPGDEGKPYFGIWKASQVRMGSSIYSAEDFGVNISAELREDGTYILSSDDTDPLSGRWTVSDSGVSLGVFQLLRQEDGTLSVESEGVTLIFVHEDASPVLQEPEPEPEPEPILPSIGEDGAPYVGTWQVITMTMGETTYNASDLGLALTMTLYEDGTAISVNVQDGSETTGVWNLTNGGVIIDGQFAVLQEDGTLFAEMDGMNMTLARPESIGSETPSVPADEGTPYFGIWHASQIRLGDSLYSAEDFGVVLSAELREDGTYILSSDDTEPISGHWTVSDAGVSLGILELVHQEDGTLSTESDGVVLIFVREESAMPEPEPKPSPEPEPKTPSISIGSASDYIGAWKAASLLFGDSTYPAEQFGYDSTLILREDSTYELMYPNSEPLSGTWTLEEDGIHTTELVFIPQEDGSLIATQASTSVIFTKRDDINIEPEPDLSAYVGEWTAIYTDTAIFKGNPQKLWGIRITLSLHADGTGELDYAGSDGGNPWWWDPESAAVYYGRADQPVPLQINEDGFLLYGTESSGMMVFSKDPDASWEPESLTSHGIVHIPPVETPANTPEPLPVSSPYLEKKFTAVSANVSGFKMDASRLGGEYSVIFHADGTAVFVMTGQEVPGLKWTLQGDDYVIDYFGSGELRFTPVSAGLELDFFGSMVLTLTAE
ncbi:MAG: leucine-rich repeat domain-containing protein [Clostridiales bacterium]|nr:leucine-rich repeat domain-containing protein [Clostridiales bacterium]